MTITGPDLSHFQQSPNFAQIKAAGHSFVVLKATEGVGYVDPTFAANRKAAHAAGLIVGMYHFARVGAVAAEAAWFLKAIGTLQTGEFLVLDQEVPNTVAWCKAWLDAVRIATGVAPLIYMNQGTGTGVTSANWSSIASTYGLWLARYDNAPTSQTAVPYWGGPALKQYTDKGTVPGVPGTCDLNSFFGTTAQLLAYGKPASTPTGDGDMTPDQAAQLKAVTDTVAAMQIALMDPAGGVRKLVGDVHGKVVDSVFDLSGRPGPDKDDLLGQVLSIRAEVAGLAAKVAKVQTGGVDAGQVAALVLAGIKAQMAADVPPAPAA